MAKERKHRRGRRQKRGFFSTLILLVSIGVFIFSAFQVYTIYMGYLKGEDEYKGVRSVAIDQDEKEQFRVDFDKLLKINPDTIGWIRFDPLPKEINYPIVQGKDNQEYLHKTFAANENTLGAIFLDCDTSPDFNAKNSIIYGHRMKNGSMFRHLQDYDSKEFWKENPYFYIYTPDGREITYHIYSAGVVEDLSESYETEFEDDAEFLDFIDATKQASIYYTGVEVGADDTVVTLSTCTSASDIHRFVVRGVKEKEVFLED